MVKLVESKKSTYSEPGLFTGQRTIVLRGPPQELLEVDKAICGMLQEANRSPRSAPMLSCILAAMLLERSIPMSPHHVSALRAYLHDCTDADLLEVVRTGKWPASAAKNVPWVFGGEKL